MMNTIYIVVLLLALKYVATEPSRAPYDFHGKSISSTEIQLTWKRPTQDVFPGDLLGYQIIYGMSTNDMVSINLDPDKTEIKLQGLSPYTLYRVSIWAYNSVGTGPVAATTLQTHQGVPSKPRITHISQRTSDSLYVHWQAPKTINGQLIRYHLRWSHNNVSKTRIISGHLTNPMTAFINELTPYTQYNIQVTAETEGGIGEFSDEFPALTDVEAPSAPRNLTVNITGLNSIRVSWEEPETYYRTIDSYIIKYWSHGGDEHSIVVKGDETKHTVADLTTKSRYYLKMAATTSTFLKKKDYVGDFTEPVVFMLETGQTYNNIRGEGNDSNKRAKTDARKDKDKGEEKSESGKDVKMENKMDEKEDTAEECPKGWHFYEERKQCYLLDPTPPLSWQQARDMCRYYGGDLTTIPDSKTNTFVKGLIKSSCEEYWIGLHDTVTENVFQWLDEDGETSFTNWAPNEPNNLGNEDCVFISAKNESQWNDADCMAKLGFSCQRASKTNAGVPTPQPIANKTTGEENVLNTNTPGQDKFTTNTFENNQTAETATTQTTQTTTSPTTTTTATTQTTTSPTTTTKATTQTTTSPTTVKTTTPKKYVRRFIKYRVVVITASRSKGGTDANVFLTIRGERGSTRRMLLDNGMDHFEQGYIDYFNLVALDVGIIRGIRIGHDDAGSGPGWFLESVGIRRYIDYDDMDSLADRGARTVSTKDYEEYVTYYHDWIATDEGNGRLYKELGVTSLG